MRTLLLLHILAALILNTNGFLRADKPHAPVTGNRHGLINAKIYSNLAEIIEPLGKLPLEFTAEQWNDIRPDSLTLVGTNVNVTRQTITETKKSFNNAQVHVRSPSSSDKETKYVKATLIDEKRNLVKVIDKDISSNPVYFIASSDHIVYDEEIPQSKYYVNVTYDTTDAVYVSYLRSNLNWKTRYQLNLFEDAKSPILIAKADIRNDGQSKVDIEHAELLGGDINLEMSSRLNQHHFTEAAYSAAYASPPAGGSSYGSPAPTVTKAEEVSGLYVFPINQPFSIEAKTNYLLPMFRPQVKVERYASISKHFYGSIGGSSGKAQRSYRLIADHFLSRGNCIIRESDRLVGETTFPDIAAKDKHEFSVGEDADIAFKENVTLISARNQTETVRSGSQIMSTRAHTVYNYNINVVLKNFKKNRAVPVEYKQQLHGHSVKLITPNAMFTQDSSNVKAALTLAPNEERVLAYRVEIIN